MTVVAVTGGSGKLGQAVVRELADSGYEVVTVDRASAPTRSPGAFIAVDMSDWGQVRQAFSGVDRRYGAVDALVHLAAVPGPGIMPDAALYANNSIGSYNAFTAALDCGIRSIVWASSETLLGIPFRVDPIELPVHEDLPIAPQTVYALAKATDEEMARHLARWHPDLGIVGLRFSNIKSADEYGEFPRFHDNLSIRRWNLWGYVDARDAAHSVRLALEAKLTGFRPYIIAAADTVMTVLTAELVSREFPDVTFQGVASPHGTLLAIDRARTELGYKPAHSWRDGISPRR